MANTLQQFLLGTLNAARRKAVLTIPCVMTTMMAASLPCSAENQISIFASSLFMNEKSLQDNLTPFRTSTTSDQIDLPSFNYGVRYTRWLGGGNLGLGLGYSSRGLRLDADLGDSNSGSYGYLKVFDTTLNGFMRFGSNGPLQPYIGAGIGSRQVDLEGGRVRDFVEFENGTVIAGFGGVSYQFTDYFALFTEMNLHYGFANQPTSRSEVSKELPASLSTVVAFGASFSF